MTRSQHGQRIVNAIPIDLRERLRKQPREAMGATGLRVLPVTKLTSSRGAGGMCDGMSFAEHSTVLYAPTDSRRENFTLLHEYGHLLVDADDAAMNWLADQEDPAIERERLCDDIAAGLLIPNYVLDQIVGNGPVTGQHLIDLFLRTQASQIVCAIALSQRLGCTGMVMLTDRGTNTVVFAALVGQPSIYATSKQAVPSGHPLSRISTGEHVCRESFWATPWGTRTAYYLNAAATDKRTYSIHAEVDVWGAEGLHLIPPQVSTDARPRRAITCGCGFSGNVTGWPCPDCGRHFCPRCQSCDCARRAARTERCDKCFVNVPRIDLVAGICSGCR
jgi:predicted RNA-binding Zn-ribbon protein involved in translation (DUF1610 family)